MLKHSFVEAVGDANVEHPGFVAHDVDEVSSFHIVQSAARCHPEGRVVCGPKDLNVKSQQDSWGEILRPESEPGPQDDVA